MPREKERIGGTKVEEKRDAAWRIVPSPPRVMMASTVRCNSPWMSNYQDIVKFELRGGDHWLEEYKQKEYNLELLPQLQSPQ